MPLRALRLPADLKHAAELVSATYQYSADDALSAQPDEMEGLVDALNSLQRFWPLVRVAQLISPDLRDQFRGCVWEEDGRLIGMMNLQRWAGTDTWFLTNVAVLPGYRHRNIAWHLNQTALDYIREHKGKVVLLEVIPANLPAYTLAKKLGFEHYSGLVVFTYDQQNVPSQLCLPEDYTVSPSGLSNWRDQCELEQRITPADITKYEPVGAKRFRQLRFTHFLMQIIGIITGVRTERIAVRTTLNGLTVAWAEYRARLRPGGVNSIVMLLDPGHSQVATYLIQHLICKTQSLSPGRRIEIAIPHYQTALIEAAHSIGCVKRAEYYRMGMLL